MRVTKLPSFEDQFGEDHNTFAGVRQSRLGVRSSTPTALGDLKTTFEFELFGTGVDEGQTTFRLRHAYGELGAFGAGQTWSPFMDPTCSRTRSSTGAPPAWCSSATCRSAGCPSNGDAQRDARARAAGRQRRPGRLRRPRRAAGHQGRFPLPDFSGAYKYAQDWGYVRAAGMLRPIKWDDMLDDEFDLSGDATGWGMNLSSNLKPARQRRHPLQFVFGEGIQNYMNDSPVDIGIVNNLSATRDADRRQADSDHRPRRVPRSQLERQVHAAAVGYSWQDNDNTDAQAPDAFKIGQYALGNLLYTRCRT